MHLYGWPLSPFVQRPLMGARLKGHELEVRVPPGGSMQSPEFQAISPMGRIPLLATDDGRHICESAAILAYLDEVLPGPSLMPADPVARARVREIEALGQNEVAAGMRPLMVHCVFRRSEAPEIVEAARAQLLKGLDAVERLRGTGTAFAAGETPGRADCLLAPILKLVAIAAPMAGTEGAIEARPGLTAYFARAAAHPVVGRSLAEMDAGFADVLGRGAA